MRQLNMAAVVSRVSRCFGSLGACIRHAECTNDVIAEVIAPRDAKLDILALENLMQSLTLSVRESIALELLGTMQERRLLVRATTVRSLAHVCAQIRAHTPQAEIRPVMTTPSPVPADHLTQVMRSNSSTLPDDPLLLREGEGVCAIDLHPRAGAHLPLKLYQERELEATGVDPLLGVFAAMDGLPPDVRVVAQLALAPAPDTWSRSMQRMAVEHPLAQERAREATRMALSRSSGSAGASAASAPTLGPVLGVIGAVVLTHLAQQRWLARPDVGQFLLFGASGIAISATVLLAVALWANARRRQVYDMRLVEERTARAAARTRLTLIAIGSIVAPAEGDGAGINAPTNRDDRAIHARISTIDLDDALDRLVAAYRQHHLANGNSFTPHRLRPQQARRLQTHWPRWVRRSRFLLNARELAALWHVPAGDAEIPLLERTRSRTHLAPALQLRAGYRLGMSRAGGHEIPVHLADDMLRRNALLVAKTGKGKSNLLLHLACATLGQNESLQRTHEREQVRVPAESPAAEPTIATARFGTTPAREQYGTGAGLAVVDPHGDLVNALLGLIPPAHRDDVVLVDLADTAYPIALNPLDVRLGRDRDKAIENLLRIFASFWNKAWGTRMQNALEFALKTLYEANEALVAADPDSGPDRQYTLLDVASILTAPSFRHAVLSTVTDDALLAWWTYYYEPLERRFQQEIINPVQTKMASFAGSRVARRIVGQGRSTLDLSEVVREGRILLVNTAKGVVGEETANLVGATLLGTLAATLEEQARSDSAGRRALHLLVDEFQTIPGVDFGAMLSELRKFGGTFVLSTQALGHLDALDRVLRPTVFANVDALYAFAMSAEDARVLARELDDVVEIADLINLDDYSCYAKLTGNGRRLPVFSLALDPAPAGDPLAARRIRARSQERYARPVAEADDMIALLAKRSRPAATLRRRSVSSDPDTGGVSSEDGPATGDETRIAAQETLSSGSSTSTAGGASKPRGRYGQQSRTRKVAPMSQPFPLWSGVPTEETTSKSDSASAFHPRDTRSAAGNMGAAVQVTIGGEEDEAAEGAPR